MKYVYLIVFFFQFYSFQAIACEEGTDCVVEVKETICGNGKDNTYYEFSHRKEAENLVIFLGGGSACWDAKSCCGAKNSEGDCMGSNGSLLRTKPIGIEAFDFIFGEENQKAPFGKGYNIAIPKSCSADFWAGDVVNNYGSVDSPIYVHQKGYKNMGHILNNLKEKVKTPKKVILMGCSLGGMGAQVSLKQVVEIFNQSKIYLASDSGIHFEPPIANKAKLNELATNLGFESSMPHISIGEDDTWSLPDITRYNSQYTNVKQGYSHYYNDYIMSLQALTVGANPLNLFTNISNQILSLERTHFSNYENQNLFLMSGFSHCGILNPGTDPVQIGELYNWLTDMVEDSPIWQTQLNNGLNIKDN